MSRFTASLFVAAALVVVGNTPIVVGQPVPTVESKVKVYTVGTAPRLGNVLIVRPTLPDGSIDPKGEEKKFQLMDRLCLPGDSDPLEVADTCAWKMKFGRESGIVVAVPKKKGDPYKVMYGKEETIVDVALADLLEFQIGEQVLADLSADPKLGKEEKVIFTKLKVADEKGKVANPDLVVVELGDGREVTTLYSNLKAAKRR